MALHVVMPKFVTIVSREIILVVFAAFCSRIHSLDVMEITQKDYNHIRFSSMHQSDRLSLYLCKSSNNFLLLVCECSLRARNTSSWGSQFQFEEREVIFSMVI